MFHKRAEPDFVFSSSPCFPAYFGSSCTEGRRSGGERGAWLPVFIARAADSRGLALDQPGEGL